MAHVSSVSTTWRGLPDNSSFEDVEMSNFYISGELELIFTSVVYGVLCQLIAVFGIVTNIINIICFIKQDFENTVNISLLGLAVSDLGCLITIVGISVMHNQSVSGANLSFDPIEVSYIIFGILHTSFSRVSSWIIAIITLERCLCVIAPLKIKSLVSPEKMAFIIIIVYIILLFSATPLYVVNRLGMKFYPLRNKTLLGLAPDPDREHVESTSFLINSFIIPILSFVVVVICTAILVIRLQKTTKWRKKTIAAAQADRVSSRNQKVSKMVVMISTLFIVCFAPFCITLLAAACYPELSYGGKYIQIALMIGGISLVFECINASSNIFIYYNISSKYRETLRIVLYVENTDN